MAAERRSSAAAAPPQGASGLNVMIETKLWRNPCWLTFRLNYLALRYNVPLYSWVQRRYGLARPEFVVIFSLGLMDGARASDISQSSGFPKNTLSRAIQKLIKARLIQRNVDPADRRGQILRLRPEGLRIFEEALPSFVEFEQRMLRTLSAKERDDLSRIMAKIVLDSVNWPEELPEE
ncbi:MAG: winged helix-turn-helix transcriptional regulator [Alphaproteobacteria bacterium]|nr:winged helix-turn-helix transcriptional regulator [Alphaproteobacteria bacterium]